MGDVSESSDATGPASDPGAVPRFFRVMKDDGGAPKIGDESCCLGVRLSDVDLTNGTIVLANGNGMSVNPTLDDLPPTFIPRRLAQKLNRRGCKGNDGHKIWRYGDAGFYRSTLGQHLELRPDATPDHGNVAPLADMLLADLQAALALTRPDWSIGEP